MFRRTKTMEMFNKRKVGSAGSVRLRNCPEGEYNGREAGRGEKSRGITRNQ
jgi:hypothetical protein